MDFQNIAAPGQNTRFYKVKNPTRKFHCALCRAPRQMKYKKNLSPKNYAQITVLSVFLAWICYPLMEVKSVFILFFVWPIVEIANKILYRREIPCPYCGFDATWYRRDVKVAKKLVEDFWQQHTNAALHSDKKSVVADENVQVRS